MSMQTHGQTELILKMIKKHKEKVSHFDAFAYIFKNECKEEHFFFILSLRSYSLIIMQLS